MSIAVASPMTPLLLDVLRFVRTLASHFASPLTPEPKPAPETPPEDPLVGIIRSVNHAFENESTASVIQALDPAEMICIASLIRTAATSCGITVAELAAYVAGESRFAPLAQGGNRGRWLPTDTPEQCERKGDWGIGQMNGAYLPDHFPPGTPWADMKAHAFDPAWALPILAHRIAADMAWGREQDAALRDHHEVCSYGRDPRVLAAQSYNRGRNGATKLACESMADFEYGLHLVGRIDSYARILGE